ncbi:MAG: 4Fe-4S dicluster domain-containing protein [Clostridia bacterium]|nr:4Fe-4S dicluster domain-containing protein [Clostridia bacterium]
MNKLLGLKKANCKNCHKCIRECPVKSIQFSDHQANILPEECILCGRCVVACPQNAKDVRHDVAKVKEAMLEGKRVVASIAPSFIADFEVNGIAEMTALLKQLGFYDVRETAEGAYIVKSEYERMIKNNEQDVIISTCCHSAVLLVSKYYTEALPYLAPVLSPMLAHAKLIKDENPDTYVVFIGPCISKKDEAEKNPGLVDCVLTFEEIREWLAEEDVKVSEAINDDSIVRMSRFFPETGGIIKSMDTEDTGFRYLAVDGVKDCIAALENIINGKLSHCFVEMSICRGSCINGPMTRRYREEMLDSTIRLRNFAKPLSEKGSEDFNISADVSLTQKYEPLTVTHAKPSDEQITAILAEMGKTKPEHELNCGSCGYATCREKAVAVFSGKAEPSMCLPFMMEKAESFSDKIIMMTPNAIMVLDDKLNVQQMNRSAKRLFNLPASLNVKNMPAKDIIDTKPYSIILSSGQKRLEQRRYLADYNKYVKESILYDKDHKIIICIMKDITDEHLESQRITEIRQQTVNTADKVIEKQMRVVQEIASLLGETTAETKIALTKLKEAISVEESQNE